MKRANFRWLTTLALVTASPASFALNVAYIEDGGTSVGYLTPFGDNVTVIANPTGLTASALSGYNAVLVASNGEFSDPTGIGNALTQYANAGGGVVLTEFDFQSPTGLALGGTINNPGYSPFTVSSGNYYGTHTLSTVFQSSSPILNGVNVSSVTTNYASTVGLSAGATLVADWSNGSPAIAYNSLANSKIVGLNLYPDAAFLASADYALVANALVFSTQSTPAAPVPLPASAWLMLSGVVGFGAFARRRGIV